MIKNRVKMLMKNTIFLIGIFLTLISIVPIVISDTSVIPSVGLLIYPYFTLVMGSAFTFIGFMYEIFIRDR